MKRRNDILVFETVDFELRLCYLKKRRWQGYAIKQRRRGSRWWLLKGEWEKWGEAGRAFIRLVQLNADEAELNWSDRYFSKGEK